VTPAEAPTADQRKIFDLEAALKSVQAEYEVLSANATTLNGNHEKLKSAFETLRSKFDSIVTKRDTLAKQLVEAKKAGGGAAARPWLAFTKP
jgi:chromosome segregation ATPase